MRLPKIQTLVFLFLLYGILAKTVPSEEEAETITVEKSDAEKFSDIIQALEDNFKYAMKGAVRSFLPGMLKLNEERNISRKCSQSLMKYVVALTKGKLWAVKMLDATSKLPPGILMGTMADFGSFDECLDIEVRQKNGQLAFRGSSCAVEAKPPLPPKLGNFSLANVQVADPEDTFGAQFHAAYEALHAKALRLIVCLPSACSVEDVQHIADKVANATDFQLKIPKCYTKEASKLEPIHVAVIITIVILFVLSVAGSVLEHRSKKAETERQKDTFAGKSWFNSLQFELIHNGWLAVETFFLLSGILFSYAGLKAVEKVKGRINIPLLALRRYVRLTPPLLLMMGVVFFLPLLSSGPFWYRTVDPQVESCRKYWWTTLLYFSNWWGIDKGCILTTWYLAADFQLHILSLILLIILFKYATFGLSILVVSVAISCATVGIQTMLLNLTPTISLATSDDAKVLEVVNNIHVQTFTHLGPHCIGMVFGYFIYKYKDQKLSKPFVIAGWLMSIILCLTTVLGNHRFTTGAEKSRSLAIFYAAMHRSVFILGVGWVVYACIKGYGGPVNSLLSSAVLAPPGRLTFMVYLVHPLVIWTKLGSFRERMTSWHYEGVYLFIANVAISYAVAVPFYLLLEAPLANIDRMLFMRHQSSSDEEKRQKETSPPMNDNVVLNGVRRYPQELRPDHLESSRSKAVK
ncbi:nose resistant to fluoxetine protein 6-like isoform X2 [Stegodyphus dumicola]|uniref:nose resistant to fluoxetine protein 6-like isoform X2 n=1 Tax=Stegodyphus dumicola TaxID=202533 RepID=UPI0015B20F93|nr:nose resistant to fluoxetine protein 6-like isoform X2 [Stegodyphus dumicola]